MRVCQCSFPDYWEISCFFIPLAVRACKGSSTCGRLKWMPMKNLGSTKYRHAKIKKIGSFRVTLFHVCADYLCNNFTAEGSAVLLEIMVTNEKIAQFSNFSSILFCLCGLPYDCHF